MVARYHLGLLAVSLLIGCLIAISDRLLARFGSARLGARMVAIGGLTGAVVGSWTSPRGWPWLMGAAVLVLFADDRSAPHPLGRAALSLTVLSLIGVWSAVPDTEPALTVAAMLVPLAVLRALRGPAVGPVGTAALVVAVSGAVWVGSAGWGAALSTVCVLGFVAWFPLVTGFGTLLTGRSFASAVGAHALVALFVPRLLMERSVPIAVALALGVSVGFLMLALMLSRRAPVPADRLG